MSLNLNVIFDECLLSELVDSLSIFIGKAVRKARVRKISKVLHDQTGDFALSSHTYYVNLY